MNTRTFWQYSPEFTGSYALLDPRIPIAKHIGWEKYTGPDTVWSVPEPDNYNAAAVFHEPRCCDLARDQVIYKNTQLDLWFTVAVIPEEQIPDFNRWIILNQPLAWWKYRRAAPIRKRRAILQQRGLGDPTKEMTLNERLYTMNYFENLQSKYALTDDIIVSRVGLPRGNLTSLIQDESSA